MTHEPIDAEPLSYESPRDRAGGRAATGFALVFGGLGLVFLGGCFLIGVLILNFAVNEQVPPGMRPGQVLLCVVLYAVAAGCFGGAVYLLYRGVRFMLSGR